MVIAILFRQFKQKINVFYLGYEKLILLLFIPLVFRCSGHSDSDSCITNTTDSSVVCIGLYEPVCGCNNVTYSNYCYAGASGISI